MVETLSRCSSITLLESFLPVAGAVVCFTGYSAVTASFREKLGFQEQGGAWSGDLCSQPCFKPSDVVVSAGDSGAGSSSSVQAGRGEATRENGLGLGESREETSMLCCPLGPALVLVAAFSCTC